MLAKMYLQSLNHLDVLFLEALPDYLGDFRSMWNITVVQRSLTDIEQEIPELGTIHEVDGLFGRYMHGVQ